LVNDVIAVTELLS